jgi:circadian clock protein KaiC
MNRLPTGVDALDHILQGGLPSGSTVLLTGSPGTGKTILANQIVFNNASADSRVLYLTTMSEPQAKILKFQNEFSYFDIEKFQSCVFYYDLSAVLRRDTAGNVLSLIDELLHKHQPAIVVIDTIKVLDDIVSSAFGIREFILDLSMKLAVWDCTALLIGEYGEGEIMARPESAIADGIIYLYGTEEKKYQKRYLRILKMRGTDYYQGEIFFKIKNSGLEPYPRLNPDISVQSYIRDYTRRVSTGVAAIDNMMGGRIPESTVTLVSGGAGTGKTVISASFAFNGLTNGEAVIYVTFEENPAQFVNSARSIGFDIKPYIETGQLTLIHVSPVELNVDEHIFMIQEHVRKQGQAARD